MNTEKDQETIHMEKVESSELLSKKVQQPKSIRAFFPNCTPPPGKKISYSLYFT